MKSLFKRIWNDDRGNMLVLAGATMPIIVGAAGLATDTVQWTVTKRQLQRAADSAAFAGVYANMQGQTVNDAVADDLGHNNTTGLAPVGGAQITYPADTADYSNAVRVELTVQRPLSFTSMFLTRPVSITAAGTAAITPTGEYCVISLENSSATGITASGSTGVDLGCGMITNSTSLDAAVAQGASSVNASPIAAVGGIDTTGNWGEDTQFLPFTLAQEDPFEDVTANPPSSCDGGQLRVNPGVTKNVSQEEDPEDNCYTLMDLKGNVTFEPGVYYISGGDMKINSGAVVNATGGVTFILTNVSTATSASIGNTDWNGGATIKIESPDTGDYAGIAVYQDRRATDSGTGPKINGGSGSELEGAFYFPSRELTFNGNAGMTTNCVQMVARRVKFTGNSNISNSCDSSGGAQAFEGQHVRLVG
ncbi:pilus assembly protein TadG-related protein [Sphingomicrobium clamense]|uniref:Putative Flp pilus-assembly TadG-like N-terminal domain-containing protein n=1 Tax=Sphingomicrobium clamense TaxID=2851013 RepID=A0ABS6V5B7_9SPHN|nr:pilus assembly protein TadG-related protein [Sphingomicrobium sp. B8]MBW0144756.1 hypothetical protein [Sphingomicrobium sp. B8]